MTAEQAAANRAAIEARQARGAGAPWVICCPTCGFGHSAAIGCPHCHPFTLFGNHGAR